MLKKEEIYVSVESKEQAEMFRKVLEAMGEPISTQYFPFRSGYQLRLSIHGNWLLGEENNELSKINFGELIDLLQRKPLFKTTNGIDIFKGDTFYWVTKLPDRYCNPIQAVMNDNIPESDLFTFDSNESAIEWIEAQKPKSITVELLTFEVNAICTSDKVIIKDVDEEFSVVISKEKLAEINKAMEELQNA